MQLQGKQALVTGATGTVGGQIALRLMQAGMRVRALVRRPEEARDLAAAGIEIMPGDLNDAASIAKVMAGAQLVVHSAAYIGGDLALAEATNVQGTRHMVEAALQAKPEAFVHISTISVYDLYNQKEFSESSPLCPAPSNPYQATKTAAEQLVWKGAAAGLPVLVIRPCNVLSAQPRSYWGARALEKVAAGFDRWHPEGLFPWVHVDNLADLVLLALGTPGTLGQAFNAIDGYVPEVEYWGKLARWAGNTNPPVGQPLGWHFSMEKSHALGYRPRVSFADAMEELAVWARANGYQA